MEYLKRIEELLNRYYQGETSLEEEKELARYFRENMPPEHLRADADLFTFCDSERRTEPVKDLEQRISDMVDRQNRRIFFNKERVVYLISAAAAGILILLTVYLESTTEVFHRKQAFVFEDTYDDPQIAYLETKKTLLLVSEKLNTGTRNLDNLQKFNQNVRRLEPVFSFGPGLQKLELLSKFSEAQE